MIAGGEGTAFGIFEPVEALLLRRFAAGRRLKKSELVLLGPLFPARVVRRVLASGAYEKSYAEYAEFFGVSERTVKHWIAQGKAKSEVALPPLDEPGRMPGWWKLHMKQRCPDNVLSMARAAGPSLVASDAAPGVAVGGERAAVVDLVEVGGFEQNLNNLRRQVAIAYRDLEAAQAKRDDNAIEQARRRWLPLDAQLQKMEERAPDILAKIGRYIDREELQASLSPMLSAVADSIRSLPRRLRSRLADAVDEAEEDAVWQAGVDECFEELQRAGYAKPFSLVA